MMNQMQTRPAVVPDALQALMVLKQEANPTAPGPGGKPIPSIAEQAAQQAQGIMQGMGGMPASPMMAQRPGINMAAQQSAQAAQPATQGQLQQLAQAMQSQGVAGLPAPNMQRFRQGGIIGFDGRNDSFVKNPESDFEQWLRGAADRKPSPEEVAAKIEEQRARAAAEEEEIQQRPLRRLWRGAKEMIAGPISEGLVALQRMREGAPRAAAVAQPAQATPVSVPDYSQDLGTPMPTPPKVAPAPRPPGPGAAPVARPPVAAAQPAAEMPTPEDAVQAARAAIGLPGTEDLRAAERKAQTEREALGPTGQLGLAALRQQAQTDAALEAEAEKNKSYERGLAWLMGGAGGRRGGSAAAAVQFDQLDMQRRRLAAERNVVNQTKQDAIIDLNNAKKANDAAAAAQAQARILGAEQKEAEIVSKLAENVFQSQAVMRGQDLHLQGVREQIQGHLQVARIQADARQGDAKALQAVARVQQAINGSALLKGLAERAKFDPDAAAEYRAEETRLYLKLAPELMIPTGAPSGGGASTSSTRSAADKILSGGK